MAEVKKARLFLRRGSDTDRKLTTLCEGELGYSTDAFRVVVGDGSTVGGKSLGTTVFLTGGNNLDTYQTTLTEASAAGYAHKGDLALFPAHTYLNAAGGSVTVANSATVVMMLTGADGSGGTASSWVALNSGIPWGNLHVGDNDISGDKIHGGTISGDITLAGTLSCMAVSAQGDVRVASLTASSPTAANRSVVADATGKLLAVDATEEVTAATATGAPVAMVTFGQKSSSGTMTLKYALNTTSVTEKLHTYANTNNVYEIGLHTAGSGSVNTYTAPSSGAITGGISGSGASAATGTGVYEIVFAQAVDGHADRPVIITPQNWRGIDFDDYKASDLTSVPTVDYKWLNSTTMVVVFSTAIYNISDHKSHGSLRSLTPNAGFDSSKTLFTVQVF